MPDRIAARLTVELDAVQPGAPEPAGARYRAPAPGPAWQRRPRFAGYALAGAVGAILMAAGATFATGSPNPQVWTMRVAGGIHRLQEPEPPLPTPTAAPTDPEGAKTVVAPAPRATSGGGHGQPGGRPPASAQPQAHESPEPEESPDSHEGRPAPSAKPSEDPRDGDADRGREASTPLHRTPSPRPSDR